jgi:hypothetical protein
MIQDILNATDKFKWVLLLLPGILTAACIGLVTDVFKLTELQIFLAGSLMSIPLLLLVSAGLYLILAGANVVARGINRFTTLTVPIPRLKVQTFWVMTYCLALLASPVAGANFAVVLERDLLHRAASTLTFFGLLDSESLWSPIERLRYANTRGSLTGHQPDAPDVLDNRPPIPGRKSPSRTGDAYFEVYLKSNQAVFVGFPRLYARRGVESEIYLSPACEVRSDSSQMVHVAGPGVVIKEREIAFVKLIDRQERNSGAEHPCIGQLK